MVDRFFRTLVEKEWTVGKEKISFADVLLIVCTVLFGCMIRKALGQSISAGCIDFGCAFMAVFLIRVINPAAVKRAYMAFSTVIFFPPLLIREIGSPQREALAAAFPNAYQIIGMHLFQTEYTKAGLGFFLFLVVSVLFWFFDRKAAQDAVKQKAVLVVSAFLTFSLCGMFFVPGAAPGWLLPANIAAIVIAYLEPKKVIAAFLLAACTFASYTAAFGGEMPVPLYVYAFVMLLLIVYYGVDLYRKFCTGQGKREETGVAEVCTGEGKKEETDVAEVCTGQDKREETGGQQTSRQHMALMILYMCIVTVGGLAIRYVLRGIESMDYAICLKPWVETFKKADSFRAIAGDFYNYTPPYMYILYGISRIDANPLYLIKLVSTVFDFLLALLSGAIVMELTRCGRKSVLAYGIVFCLPTVFVNSGLWAQCDVIYVTFIIASIYFLYKEKSTLSMLCYGMAFALKLQTLFVFPMFVYLWVRKKYRIGQFLYIPFVYGLMCIPSFLAGKSLRSLLLVYVEQGNTEPWMLSWNWPNIYLLFGANNFYKRYASAGVIGTIAVLMFLLYVMLKKGIAADKQMILKGMLMFSVVVPFFLPYMHERYGFLADILAVILFFSEPATFPIAVAQVLLSATAYTGYLHGASIVPQTAYCFLMVTLVIICVCQVIRVNGAHTERER